MVLTVLKYKKPTKHSLSRDNYKWLGKRLGFMIIEQTSEHHRMLERFIQEQGFKTVEYYCNVYMSRNWNDPTANMIVCFNNKAEEARFNFLYQTGIIETYMEDRA